MNVFDLSARIGLNSDDYDKGLSNAESAFSKVASGIKNGIGTIAKVTAAGFTAAATGIAALSKQAIESYADYEQLVGGVETLFKDSADKVQEYANEAYKTAGLSANEYMETVTGFSASLLQSLGGDTEKAADKANQALIDMSDNANKMGSDMEMIKNAYAGFAKQNYTMLDNLKLGYGGTKQEMERLLADAEKFSGIKYNIESYADVIDAIHVIQTEMGVTGTTAKEAASTISGSIGMMKSSWQNLITGIADDTQDFDGLVNNFVDSVDTVAQNIMPRVEQAIGGVGKLVEKLVPTIFERIPDILNNTLPQLIDSASTVLGSMVNAIISNIDNIFHTASSLTQIGITLIEQIAEGAVSNTDAIIDGIAIIFNDFIESIGVIAPILFDAGLQILMKIGEGIVKYAPDLIDTAIIALEDFATYIADNASVMLPKIVELVMSIAEMLTDPDMLVRLLDAAIKMIIAIAEGLL